MLNKFNLIKKNLNDPLFKNSYFLIGNTLLFSLIGFVFWIIAARLYTPEELGLASAIVSAMSLLSLISLLGFDISIIRFLHVEKYKSDLINSMLVSTAISSLIISTIFILGINFWSPGMSILKSEIIFGVLFIVFSTFCTLYTLQTNIFVALRKAKYSFYQAIANSLRLPFLLFLYIFGTLGIVSSYGIVYVLTFFIGNKFINIAHSSYKFNLSFKISLLKNMIKYSFQNYISNILNRAPNYILPLLVLNLLSAELNAYFYIAWTFAMILLVIPSSTSRSLLAEGASSNENFNLKVFKSLKFTLGLSFLGIMGIVILGKYLLYLFGPLYAENSYIPLVILSISSIPYSIIQLYMSVKRVENDIKPVILTNAVIALVSILGSYVFLKEMGIIAICYSWLGATTIVCIGIIIGTFYKRNIKKEN